MAAHADRLPAHVRRLHSAMANAAKRSHGEPEGAWQARAAEATARYRAARAALYLEDLPAPLTDEDAKILRELIDARTVVAR